MSRDFSESFEVDDLELETTKVVDIFLEMTKYFNPGSETMPNGIYNHFKNCNPQKAMKDKEASRIMFYSDRFAGFKFWEKIFGDDNETIETINMIEEHYKENAMKRGKYTSLNSKKWNEKQEKGIADNYYTYATNFLLNVKADVDYDFMPEIREDLRETVISIYEKEDSDKVNNLCKFLNNMQDIAKERRKEIIDKNTSTLEFVDNILKSIEESGKKSMRDSEISGTMYTELKSFSAKLKTSKEYEVLEEDLNSLNETAQKYLSHKVKDGYNSNAYGKISAADGIMKFVNAYKIDNINALKSMSMRNAEEVMKDGSLNNLRNMKREKVSFTKLLKEEMGIINKKPEKTVKAEKTAKLEKKSIEKNSKAIKSIAPKNKSLAMTF